MPQRDRIATPNINSAHCRRCERLESALHIIHTWASVQHGIGLNARDVLALTGDALREPAE